MIRVFIGYDPTEEVAAHVLWHSIQKHASEPVSVGLIRKDQLRGTYMRPRASSHSTEFSLSRFLVPYICGFEGWAIFMDCDMLVRSDIAELWNAADESYSVQVVQHDYLPKTDIKMQGAVQTTYAKKNWSSVMLMNCAKCTNLLPGYVNKASGLDLHQFNWCSTVGYLPTEWNWLVGEYPHNPDARCAHFTLGGPWWGPYQEVDYAQEWREAYEEMTAVEGRRYAQTTSIPASRREEVGQGAESGKSAEGTDSVRIGAAGYLLSGAGADFAERDLS